MPESNEDNNIKHKDYKKKNQYPDIRFFYICSYGGDICKSYKAYWKHTYRDIKNCEQK